MPFVQTITRSLLDRDAVTLIARQLWTARQRLQLHAGSSNIPSAVELAIALRLHMDERDAARAAHAARSPRGLRPPATPADAPPLPLLHFLLDVADAAYDLADATALRASLTALQLPQPLALRAAAAKWAPGFFVVHDARRDALILAVRGSREVGDLITNLSTDITPFLAGRAHAGIAAAARNLHATLRRTLGERLVATRPRNGLLVVGHSLGGATAAALVLLLRAAHPPPDEPAVATALLRGARCYAFAPPPFASPALARVAAHMPIFSIVYGLDFVPRLSAASVDRLLRVLAAYDWASGIGSRIGAAVSGAMREVGFGADEGTVVAGANGAMRDGATATGGARPPRAGATTTATATATATSPSPSASLDHGVLANVSGTIATVADGALQARGLLPSTAAGAALNAALFVTRALGRGVQGNARRVEAAARERESNSLDRSLNTVSYPPPTPTPTPTPMGDGPVARAARRESDRLGDVLLAGEVWHLVPRFRPPGQASATALAPRDVALVRRAPRFFRDVEVSGWMTSDHYPKPMREALQLLRRRESETMSAGAGAGAGVMNAPALPPAGAVRTGSAGGVDDGARRMHERYAEFGHERRHTYS